MSNQLTALLDAWERRRDSAEWVLGTVYKTEGSAYRKAGAMMLINSLGQQFGLLSGGCLEADIVLNARKVMRTGCVALLTYDGSDEDDWSFQLGIGCGGKVYIMLQPLSAENDLGLSAMALSLRRRESGTYYQRIGSPEGYFDNSDNGRMPRSVLTRGDDGDWLVTPINPEPHLLVVGGGIDARPLVNMASELGWKVTLADPRPANARREHFDKADHVLRELGDALSKYIAEHRVDAAVVMSHNVDIDAEGLSCCQASELKYVALLGPRHRYRQVLDRAGLEEAALSCPVSAPAGFDIGGQLPESIALSILAECHGVLHKASAQQPVRLASVQ